MPIAELSDPMSLDNESPIDLMTVEEVAKRLRMRPSTIRDWILKRRIPFVKFSRRVFLRRGDIEGLIAKGVVPASRP